MTKPLPATVILLVALCIARAQGERPNFVFIVGDDITYNDLPAYGGRNIATPNIDRLVRDGMRFTRAYCAMSMCAPFRAELYTGLYPVRNGTAWNHSISKQGTKSVCHYLRDLGYRVGICGKVHVKPQTVFPFDIVRDFPAGAAVRAYLTKDADQPFCLFVCSQNAHPPWRSGKTRKLDPNELDLPPVLHDDPTTRDTYARYLAEIEAFDEEVGAVLALLEETGTSGNTLVMLSSEQGWDFAFGKWTNWDIGIHTALIARWPSHIPRGSQTDALVQMADVVPTWIEAAGGDPESYDLDGRSFLPVLLGRSTTHREYVYSLHNNVPEGDPYPIRSICDGRFHYLMNLAHDRPYHEKHLMTENLAKRYDLQWWQTLRDAAGAGDADAKRLYEKYHDRPAEELYRVDEDPWEMNNLAGDLEYIDVKKRLRGELIRWMGEQNDPGAAMDTPAAYAANREAGKNFATKRKPGD